MTKLNIRLQRLERHAAPDDRHLITIARYLAEDPTVKLMARVVSLPDFAPTADAIAARARLTAEGYDVLPGYGGRAA